MLTPLEAGLQPDPCLFIEVEEEGPWGWGGVTGVEDGKIER